MTNNVVLQDDSNGKFVDTIQLCLFACPELRESGCCIRGVNLYCLVACSSIQRQNV